MAFDKGIFETLNPSRFVSFTFPNPDTTKSLHNRYGDFLRIAVLDSPVKNHESPQVAAMLVPIGREDDWIFSTETGHIQLLLNFPGISRLILVGNLPLGGDYFPAIFNRPERDDTASKFQAKFEECLFPILLALSPKLCFKTGVPHIPFLGYEDNVIRSAMIEICMGSCVGEMLVEDVEIESFGELDESPIREFRRRLRFKRMPNLVQTEIRISPDTRTGSYCNRVGNLEFRPETGELVHPYLPPMVASLSLIASYLEEKIELGTRPRVLCVGVGGGALLTFLNRQFGLEVMGVEADDMVLRVARLYFGLVDDEHVRVCVGDGIEVVEEFARRAIRWKSGCFDSLDVDTDQSFYGCDCTLDVIMVDLDSSDARNGASAPPLEFVQKPVLLAAKSALHSHGIIVINVIPQDRPFYESLVREFREVFSELYEIDVGNGENYVLIAAASPITTVSSSENSIIKKSKMFVLKEYIDSIRKI